ncbi:MAG: hypothetical protein J7M17_00890 [Anaerolineae bacterium]|nr:hypothetical protein [Anaerolineae bacterium]
MRARKLYLAASIIALLNLAFLPGATLLDPLPPVTETAGTLGTCYSAYDSTYAQLAYNAGSRWDRFDFRWSSIEPHKGSFNFGPHDTMVNRDRAQGLDIVGILGSTPEWAADPSCTATAARPVRDGFHPQWEGATGWPYHCPPETRYEPWTGPGSANDWGNYVYQVVSHFRGRVAVWEIWNEPDVGYFWAGTRYAYAQMLKVGYQAVKAADPDATVLFGGLAYWGNTGFYTAVLDVLAADPASAAHNYYFDVMSLHLYASVYQTHEIATSVMQNVSSRVGSHPLWLTETGVKVWNEDEIPPGWLGEWPPYYSATAAEAAAYVIAAYADARAAGVERIFTFRLHDDTGGMPGQRYGLVRDDYSLRPAYLAYQTAARYLHGENQITGPFDGVAVRRVTFWGTPHGRIDVLWNRTPTTTTCLHPAVLPTATLVTHLGVTQTLTATAGQYTLELAPATCRNNPAGLYTIGGPPVLLVQSDTTPPAMTLHSLPALLHTNPITVTWTISDSGSGPWYAEIARAPTSTGPWELAAGWQQTQGVTQTQLTLPGSGDWYFRARARDNTGNWETWPATAEISTTLHLTRTVTLSCTFFSDLNHNGLKEAAEPLLDGVTARWLGAGQQVIMETTGISGTWHITRSVACGDYTLAVEQAEHLPAHYPFTVTGGTGTQLITRTLGLHPIVGRAYLPLISRR